MRTSAAFLSLLLASLSSCTKQPHIVTALQKLADTPSKFVLYSIDPGKLAHDESIQTETVFRGYDILGHAQITDANEQRALLRALARGASQNDSTIAACFNPRHALHIEQGGRSIDFVICFECLQVRTFGFSADREFLTSRSPQSTFDDSLRRHQIPLAPQ
ncbi:MAG TPA: hypothetical protein VIW07_13355 [Candidatus Udaeobacter sp.]|jgi:hypothetical protein